MASGMVGVRLKKDWFGPDSSLYQARDNPHEFPAEYAEKPKKREEESEVAYKARLKNQPYAVLPSSAELVGEDTRTVAVFQNTANGAQVIVPTLVGDDVDKVGGALDVRGIEQPSQSVSAAEKGAEEHNVDVGGVPRKSGPLPAAASGKK